MEKGDHPEIVTSDELYMQDINIYQSLIGSLQWDISIGRVDITTAVMTMSKFRMAPRVGHMDRVKRIFSYLCRFKHATIRFITERPDYSDLSVPNYDWMKTVYVDVKEVIASDIPETLGKPVILTTFVDANLMHDVMTGRVVTVILHLINKTPIGCYSKTQDTMETATYGSEFNASRTSSEKVMELRVFLR